MCGITGFIDSSSSWSEERLQQDVSKMIATIRHRGPDDAGCWTDEKAGVALGFRRLAIIDLSADGHQPMTSTSGRYVIVFNGEIYNFDALREEISIAHPDMSWRGHSDTEVLLAAVECWGLEIAIQKFNGMFAFAIWDRQKRVLQLARDRMGEKPLYYGWMKGAFLFGSELKALKSHPKWGGEINRDALGLFVRHNYVPAPFSIYDNIFKLGPGCLLTVSLDSAKRGESEKVEEYWSIKSAVLAGAKQRMNSDPRDLVEEFDNLLNDAVRIRMFADVPLGAFLSGGIDSSTIVALMQSVSSIPINTFTIGFHEDDYDEARYSRAIAEHLGTNHTELYVTPQQTLDVIPRLPDLYDEPFADSSQIPTYVVSELARRHVTVALSGDGGDELFWGYRRYKLMSDIWSKMRAFPYPIRRILSNVLRSVPDGMVGNTVARFLTAGSSLGKESEGKQKLNLACDILEKDSVEALYRHLVSNQNSASLVLGESQQSVLFDKCVDEIGLEHTSEMPMYFDQLTYLPDDILVKVDRASMGVSLEARVPLLDHRIVEFAWSVPFQSKYKNGESKWLLRQVMHKHLPKTLTDRPKKGFSVPVAQWLKGPLRQWAEDLLSENRLKSEGFFEPSIVRTLWSDHLSGHRNNENPLWSILMFEAWLDSQAEQSVSTTEKQKPMSRHLNIS